MNETNFEALSPKEISNKVVKAANSKGAQPFWNLVVLGILAGMFIGFGAQLYTFVTHNTGMGAGLTALIGGLVFSLGLILVVIAGAELFTGNNLMLMAVAEKQLDYSKLLRNWIIVYGANFIGSILMVLLVYVSGQWATNGAAVGAKAVLIANGKVNLTFYEALVRGILCNILVVLAVWLAFSGRTVTDKILGIVFPVTAFVASGFEHSIANMYFIPMGILLKDNPEILAAIGKAAGQVPDLSGLTWPVFLIRNLVPVTLGNIIGGAVLVGLSYWFIYLREPSTGSYPKEVEKKRARSAA